MEILELKQYGIKTADFRCQTLRFRTGKTRDLELELLVKPWDNELVHAQV